MLKYVKFVVFYLCVPYDNVLPALNTLHLHTVVFCLIVEHQSVCLRGASILPSMTGTDLLTLRAAASPTAIYTSNNTAPPNARFRDAPGQEPFYLMASLLTPAAGHAMPCFMTDNSRATHRCLHAWPLVLLSCHM